MITQAINMNARVPMVVVHFLACFGIQYPFLNNSHRIINDTCKFFQDPQKINNLKWHPDYSVPHSTPKCCFPFIVQTKIQLKIMTQGVNSRVDTCKSDGYFLIRQDREAYSRSKRPFQTSHRYILDAKIIGTLMDIGQPTQWLASLNKRGILYVRRTFIYFKALLLQYRVVVASIVAAPTTRPKTEATTSCNVARGCGFCTNKHTHRSAVMNTHAHSSSGRNFQWDPTPHQHCLSLAQHCTEAGVAGTGTFHLF